jgi:N-acetylmuramoyl-L-alanine amidase
VLKNGAVVRQIEKRGSWIRIQIKGKGEAWVEESSVSAGYPVGSLLRISGDAVRIRSGPGTSFRIVTELMAGAVVHRIGQRDGWYEVRTDNGTTGWVREDLAQPLQ